MEDEQCICQEETDGDQKKPKNHELCRKLGCKITHGCVMKRTQCSAIFVENLRKQIRLHQNLKGHCHKDFAVFGQFCAKIITSLL